MKIFVTKHALTQGILEFDSNEAEIEIYQNESCCRVKLPGRTSNFYHGDNWHYTLEEAIKRAQFMRVRELKNLKEKFETVKAITFTAAVNAASRLQVRGIDESTPQTQEAGKPRRNHYRRSRAA